MSVADRRRDRLFAFVHGIRLVSEVHGKSIHDPEWMEPIFEKMASIEPSDSRITFVQAHDNHPMDEVLHFRNLEKELCMNFLEESKKT